MFPRPCCRSARLIGPVFLNLDLIGELLLGVHLVADAEATNPDQRALAKLS
jgi:hypothetical protein